MRKYQKGQKLPKLHPTGFQQSNAVLIKKRLREIL